MSTLTSSSISSADAAAIVDEYLACDALLVPASIGRVATPVVGPDDDAPSRISMKLMRALDRVLVEIGGGCKGMSPDVKRDLLIYFVMVLDGFRGALVSGGTMDADVEGLVKAMITDVVGLVGSVNPGTVVIGSTPRTKGDFGIHDRSIFGIDGGNTLVGTRYHAVMLVQRGQTDPDDWGLDLEVRRRLILNAMSEAGGGFRAECGIFANGGGVTEREIIASANTGRPTFLVSGFGAKADEYAAKVRKGDRSWAADGAQVFVVDGSDPSTLRIKLLELGFFPESVTA